jgi:hypothetical protein
VPIAIRQQGTLPPLTGPPESTVKYTIGQCHRVGVRLGDAHLSWTPLFPFERQLKFECILAYEIVPGGQGTYTIHVPTEEMLAPAERVCPTCNFPANQLPDLGPASERTEQLARTYCAKTHENMVVKGGGFDMGPGLTLVFKCVPPQQGAPPSR